MGFAVLNIKFHYKFIQYIFHLKNLFGTFIRQKKIQATQNCIKQNSNLKEYHKFFLLKCENSSCCYKFRFKLI